MSALRPNSSGRRGFTLIELLIVVGILLLMMALTLAAFSFTDQADRIRSSARQLQSSLLGGRDRALKARAAAGLRLLLESPYDPTNPTDLRSRIVTNMVYIGSQGYGSATQDAQSFWTQGVIAVGYPDFDIPGTPGIGAPASAHNESTPSDGQPEYTDGQVIVWGFNTDWSLLFQQGLIGTGSRIEIPIKSGNWYTINTQLLSSPPTFGNPALAEMQQRIGLTVIPEFLILSGNGSRDSAGFDPRTPVWSQSPEFLLSQIPPPVKSAGGNKEMYRLEVQPTVLPGQEPMKLSSGIVIDLMASSAAGGLPDSWYEDVAGVRIFGFTPTVPGNHHLDVLFSPSGVVADGPIVAGGPVHLLLRTMEDVTVDRGTADPARGEQLVLTIFPQTGLVATFPVDVTDSNSDLWADDPFRFAKIGGTAGQ